MRELFLAAAGRPAEERRAWLVGACADPRLRDEVEALLRADAADDALLDAPALGPGFSIGALPTRIGAYEVTGVIAQGAMGIVYRAEQERPRRTVAVKVLRPECASSETLERFAREAHLLGRLSHPGIAQVFEAGTADTGDGERPYLAMELVRGRPLTEHAARLPVPERVRLLARVCDAVHHAHLRGVIHRDLKPANILVDEAGRPKVLDFGVARATQADLREAAHRTDAGRMIGTLAYMSPEQVRADPDEIDARSDVYALGVLACEVLSGRLPHETAGRTMADLARAILEDEPRRVGEADRALRGDLEWIVARALEKDRARRYDSAAAIGADLERWLRHEPVEARPPGTLYQLRKFARRNRALVAGTAAVLVGLVVGVAGLAAGLRRALVEKEGAETASRAAEASAREAKHEAEKARGLFTFFVDRLFGPGSWRGGRERGLVGLLEAAESDLPRSFDGQPEIRGAVEAAFGRLLRALGRPDDAARLLGRAWNDLHQCRGERHPETLSALDDHVAALIAAGRLGEAEGLAWRAPALHPPDDPLLADALRNLAAVHAARGRLVDAELELRRAWDLLRLARGPEHPSTREVVERLADVLREQRRPGEARALLEDALRAARTERDAEGALRVAARLGVLLRETEWPRAAETMLRAALAEGREALGRGHPALGPASEALAGALEELGRLPEAEEVRIEERRAREAAAARPEGTLGDLGAALAARGRLGDAARALRELRLVALQVLGERHPSTVGLLLDLSRISEAEGRMEEAEALAGEAARTARAGSAAAGAARRRLAECLLRRDRRDEAAAELRAAVDALGAALGEEHPETQEARRALGAIGR